MYMFMEYLFSFFFIKYTCISFHSSLFVHLHVAVDQNKY